MLTCFVFSRSSDNKNLSKLDSGRILTSQEDPLHNTVFSYSYPPAVNRAGVSAFHPVSPKVCTHSMN